MVTFLNKSHEKEKKNNMFVYFGIVFNFCFYKKNYKFTIKEFSLLCDMCNRLWKDQSTSLSNDTSKTYKHTKNGKYFRISNSISKNVRFDCVLSLLCLLKNLK